MRRLEEEIGVQLIDRTGTRMVPTARGVEFAKAVADALESISSASGRLRRAEVSSELRVGAPTAIAVRLLFPRLAEFSRRHPDIEVHVSCNSSPADLRSGSVDVILSGIQHPLPPEAIRYILLSPRLLAVASPALLERFGPVDLTVSARGIRLFGVVGEGWGDEWTSFAANHGLPPGIAEQVIGMSSPLPMLEAALDGHGVALVYETLIADDLKRGTLIPLEVPGPPLRGCLKLSCLRETTRRRSLRVFRDWVGKSFASLVAA